MNKIIITEKIATPQIRLPIINIFTQHLPEKNLIAGISYSAFGRDSALYLVDIRTLAEEKYLLPEGVSCGYHGLAKSGDGDLYIGSHNGCLYKFEVANRRFKMLSRLIGENCCITGSYVSSSAVSSSGKIYVGRWPDGNFWEYNPASGETKRYETMPGVKQGLYCVDFIDLPDGRILVLVTGSHPGIIMFDPQTGKRRILYRGKTENESRGFFNGFIDRERILVGYYNSIKIFNYRTETFEGLFADIPEIFFKLEKADGAYYGSGLSSRAMYQIKDGKITKVRDNFPNLNFVNNFHYLGKDEFACIGDNGLAMRLNLKSGELVSRQVDNVSTKGMGLQFLYKVPDDDFVIGAHFICSQMFRINLKDKACESSLNKAAPYPGQINCGTALGRKFYLGSYGHAVVSEYDWKQPFVPGKNPSVIGEIGADQNRPIDMVNDGKFIYIATGAEYGFLGGAITVLEPASRQMKVFRNFVPDQNPTGLFMRPRKNLLVGGTDISGDCGTAKPTAANAVLFLWDTVQCKTVHTLAPWKQSSLTITDITPSGVGLGFKNPPGMEGAEYFLWDISSGKFEIKAWPLKGIFIGGLFMNDREFYGATENGLFVLDIKNGQSEMLTQTTKMTGACISRCFKKLNDHEFLFDIEGVNVMKAILTDRKLKVK